MKGVKQGVDSRTALLSKPGRGSERHYGQNERKMVYCVSNKSQLWHVLFCFTPAAWLHLNKYKFTISLSHTQTRWGNYLSREGAASLPGSGPDSELLKETRDLLPHVYRRWLHRFLHATKGHSLKTSLPSMGRLFKQCQACAVAQLAAQKTRWRFAGLIVLRVVLWVPSRCHSQQGTVGGLSSAQCTYLARFSGWNWMYPASLDCW